MYVVQRLDYNHTSSVILFNCDDNYDYDDSCCDDDDCSGLASPVNCNRLLPHVQCIILIAIRRLSGITVDDLSESQKAKEREERVRLARERREQAELKRLEELRESIARHQEIRRKQEEERRRRMDEMRKREEEHRNLVEERRRRLQDEENVRTAPVSVLQYKSSFYGSTTLLAALIKSMCPVWGRGTPLPPCPFTSSSFPLYFFLSFLGFTYFLLLSIPSLFTRIVPLRFQAGGRRRRPNLGLVCFFCNLCYLYSLVKMDCGVLFYLV